MLFFHIILELKNIKFTIAIETVYIYNNYIYTIIKYIRSIEKHYIKLRGRFMEAKVIKNNHISYNYKGYVPYWISSLSKKIFIYNQSFIHKFGKIYYRTKRPVQGIFVFDKNLEERFCARKLFAAKNVSNVKIIFRIL